MDKSLIYNKKIMEGMAAATGAPLLHEASSWLTWVAKT